MSNVRLVRSTNLRVRAPRVPIDLSVESRTIGTNFRYQFLTEDVSRSGLLLVWDRQVKMPFLVNTLIEITIDPDGKHLSKPVQCLGKVVRRDAATTEANNHGARLGIQIVQIDNNDLAAWEGCLAELERRFGIEPAAKIAAA